MGTGMVGMEYITDVGTNLLCFRCRYGYLYGWYGVQH